MRKLIITAVAALLAAGCASTPAADAPGAAAGPSWLMLTQVDRRFAVFIDRPGPPLSGGLATLSLVYVYAPGAVMHEGKEVGWQQYHAVTVNCAENTVKLGARTRYAPDGSVMMSDDSQDFSSILGGTAADNAARVRCRNETPAGNVSIPGGADWIAAARAHILANDPPPR